MVLLVSCVQFVGDLKRTGMGGSWGPSGFIRVGCLQGRRLFQKLCIIPLGPGMIQMEGGQEG